MPSLAVVQVEVPADVCFLIRLIKQALFMMASICIIIRSKNPSSPGTQGVFAGPVGAAYVAIGIVLFIIAGLFQ